MLGQHTHDGTALAARLVEALKRDATGGFSDEAIIELLDPIEDGGEPFERLKLTAILIGLARRVEGGGSYPSLIRTAAGFADGHEGSERERAIRARSAFSRPLAKSYVRAE